MGDGSLFYLAEAVRRKALGEGRYGRSRIRIEALIKTVFRKPAPGPAF
jgi:hypothetical protein